MVYQAADKLRLIDRLANERGGATSAGFTGRLKTSAAGVRTIKSSG
jgi:hypothetical protein